MNVVLSPWLLLGAVAFLLLCVVVLAIAVFGLRREQARQAEALTALQKDLRALVQSALQVGERVSRLERTVKEVVERQDELGLRQERMDRTEAGEQSYAQAIKLALKGAGAEELMDICGLARGEAELITMMHRLGSS